MQPRSYWHGHGDIFWRRISLRACFVFGWQIRVRTFYFFLPQGPVDRAENALGSSARGAVAEEVKLQFVQGDYCQGLPKTFTLTFTLVVMFTYRCRGWHSFCSAFEEATLDKT